VAYWTRARLCALGYGVRVSVRVAWSKNEHERFLTGEGTGGAEGEAELLLSAMEPSRARLLPLKHSVLGGPISTIEIWK
jgi:hypothetical protein